MSVDWDAIIERVPVLQELADAINEREVTGGAIGGTDDDGNVYSATWDGAQIIVKCVKLDGSTALTAVGSNFASLRYSDEPNDVVYGVIVGPEGVNIAAGIDGDGTRYDILFDPDNHRMNLKSETTDGQISRVIVGYGLAMLTTQDTDGNVSRITVDPVQGALMEAVGGEEGPNPSVSVSQDNGVQINGNPLVLADLVYTTDEISNPTGGGTIDTEARAAIDAILARMAPPA